MQVVAVCNMKGGVGKTATATNLAPVFASRGRRTLLVDTEGQGDASAALGVRLTETSPALAQVLVGAASFDQAVVHIDSHLSVLPSATDVDDAQRGMTEDAIDAAFMAALLEAANAGFELAVIDTQPNRDSLTRAALHYADVVVAPVNARDMNSVERLDTLHLLMQEVDSPATLRILLGQVVLSKRGVLGMFGRRVHAAAYTAAKEKWGDAVLEPMIQENALMQEATAEGRRPMSVDHPDSSIAGAYRSVVEELEADLAAAAEE
jgi:chromosome partitioning protein